MIKTASPFQCRVGCGACCVAPSISSAIPGMPHGKPAGVRCIQLNDDNRCKIFGRPERPKVCSSFEPKLSTCGETDVQAFMNLDDLEHLTRPQSST